MRSDELAAQSEIERDRKFREGLGRGVKTAVGLGTTALGVGITAKIMPFLSEFITPEQAIKGISKVSPKLGEFFKKGRDMGLNVEDGLNFIKERINPEKPEKSKKSSDLSEHPIERNDLALHQFLINEIGKGRKPQEALAVAKVQGFDKNIQALSKKIGKNLFDIIEQIYGTGTQSKTALQPNPDQPTQQSGQGQQALMAILEKIRQSRGAQ